MKLAIAGSQYVTFADPAFRLRRWRNWEATMQGCFVYCVVWCQNVSDLWWHLAHIKAMQPGLAKEICSRSPQLQILQKVSARRAFGCWTASMDSAMKTQGNPINKFKTLIIKTIFLTRRALWHQRISKQCSLDLLRKFAADHLSYRFSKRSRRVWLLDSFHGFGYENTGVDEAGIMANAHHCQSTSCLILLVLQKCWLPLTCCLWILRLTLVYNSFPLILNAPPYE